MKAQPISRVVTLTVAGIAAVILIGFVAMHMMGQPSKLPDETAQVPQQPAEESLPPSLDCAFRFASSRIYFYFDVAISKGEPPRFFERTFVSADGSRKTYAGDGRPAWTYGFDADGKQVITSPDAATRIVLYGLKLGVPGVLGIEAGIRSNVYRNLGGECRQTNLDGP